MALLSIDGLDELMNDLEAVAEIPDGVAGEMLNRQADVVARAQRARIGEIGLVDSGMLLRSVRKTGRMIKKGANRSTEVYPQGTRPDGVTNATVGFVHEYGASGRHIPAKNWMSQANEACAAETTEAAREVYNEFLTSKNL